MDQPIADADLVPKLQAASQNDTEQRIYLRASKVVPYGRVAQIMASVTAGGFQEGGAGHRADESVAGSGFGRAAVILGLGGLERAPWRPGSAPDPGIRRGAEIRGQPGSDPRRNRLRDAAQPDHERREGRQARAPAAACAESRRQGRADAALRRPSRRPNCARPTSPSPRRRRRSRSPLRRPSPSRPRRRSRPTSPSPCRSRRNGRRTRRRRSRSPTRSPRRSITTRPTRSRRKPTIRTPSRS